MLDLLFSNIYIPIVLFFIGFIVLISIHLNGLFKYNRKVTLKKRTVSKQSIRKKLFNIISSKLEKSEKLSKLIDKGQFIYGYFSAASEEVNREKVKSFFLKLFFYDVIMITLTIIFVKTIFSKVIIISIILLLEYMIITSLINKRKTVLKDEFHILVRQFIEGYVLSNNIRTSFESTLSDLSPIYQIHVSRLINQLSSTTDANEAFDLFDKRINYSMCSCFVSIVQSSLSNNKNIIDNLLHLQSILQDDRNIEKNIKNTQASKIKVIYFWILMILIELLVEGKYFATATGNYFFTTSMGQSLLLGSIMFSILSLVCIKIVDNL